MEAALHHIHITTNNYLSSGLYIWIQYCYVMYILSETNHVTWLHGNKSWTIGRNRCWQSPNFEPVNMFKPKKKIFQKLQSTCLCTTAYSFFFHFPCDLLSLKSHRSAPMPRTIITLVCDPRRVAGREMNSQVGLQGLGYYFVWTNTACSSPHSFTWSDWCWQFPQTKLWHSKEWSMALISQILTSIRPWSNLFLPTTKSFWCSNSTHAAAAKPRF